MTDKSISHRNSIHHDFYGIFSKEKFQKIYLDDEGNVVLTKTALGELSMSDKMLIKRWAERAENDETARKLALKPDAAIGMTKTQVHNKTNWRSPNYVKTTTTAYGTYEQWVCDDYQCLYFDNGKLTTIQQ